MFTNYSKIPIKLAILLVGFGLLVVGCDSVGPSAEKADNALLKVTNDLGDRMTVYGNGSASTLAATNASAKFSLKAVSQIDPPTSSQTASHISSSSGDIFVGYKVPGETFGGGVDILDKSTPTRLTNEDNALRSADLDVQEVVYDDPGGNATNNLFIAGAVDYSNIDARDYGNTPAVMIRAGIDDNGNVATVSGGNVEATEVAMPDALVKSVTLAGANDGTHDLYAVTDGDSFFEFDSDLGSREEYSQPNTEFNSVATAGPNAAFALSKAGKVFRVNTTGNNTGTINEVQDFSQQLQVNGIARVSTHDHGSPVNERLSYIALNEGGLAVINGVGNAVRYRKSDVNYVSVTATDDRVYAAGPGGTIDVFSVTSGLTNTNTSKGLSLEGSFDLGGLDEIGTGSGSIGSAQVNQILATSDYLYVAAGTEGTIVLEIASNQGDIF